MKLLPVKTKGNDHDVRCYGLQYGLAPSAWNNSGGARDRSARQICVLRQTVIEDRVPAQPDLHRTVDAGGVRR